jgi:hypothetical protein
MTSRGPREEAGMMHTMHARPRMPVGLPTMSVVRPCVRCSLLRKTSWRTVSLGFADLITAMRPDVNKI